MTAALAKVATAPKAAPAPPNADAVAPKAPPPVKTVSAVEMGARQRESSVSEFFTKTRHLLGFDNPRKAMLTCVKEAVDNALDAAEEAGILPDVLVSVEVVPANGGHHPPRARGGPGPPPAVLGRGEGPPPNGGPPPPASQATRFRVTVSDNGPGI